MSETTIIRETDVTTVVETGRAGPPGPPGPGGVLDHGLLTGLADDDHPQYLTTGRGDARYEPTGAVAAEVTARDVAIETHRADTTNVHGIADTALLATQAYVLARVAELVNTSPAELDTFLEVYNRFLTDESAATALTTTVAGKQAAHADLTALSGVGVQAYGKALLALTSGAAFTTLLTSLLNGTYLPRAPSWVTGRAYVLHELVTNAGTLYEVTTAHTSGASFDATKFTALGAVQEQIEDYVGALLAGDSADLDFTYDDAGGAESAVIKAGAVTPAKLDRTYANALTRTAVKTANYTAVAGDLVPVDTTSGAVTVTLPSAPADRTRLAVKHIIQGGTNAVTVACAGTDVFNKAGGSTSGTLPLVNQAFFLEYTATGGIWTVLADDLPLSGLDLRYVPLIGGTTASPYRVKSVLKFAAQDGVGAGENIRVLDADSPSGPFMSLEFNNALATSPEGIHLTTGSAFAGGLGSGQNVLAIGNNYGGVAIFVNNYLNGVGIKITNRSTGTVGAVALMGSQSSDNDVWAYLSQETSTAKPLIKLVSAPIGTVGGAGAATNQVLSSAVRSQSATGDTTLWTLCVDIWDVRVPVTVTGNFTANTVQAQTTGAYLDVYDTGGTANSRRFRFSQNSGSFLITARNDDGTNKGTVFQVSNSGTITLPNAQNIVVGTSTGTKIGTATSQKLGFFNATPVIQPTGTPAAATDLASVISLANSLRTNLLALGLVA